MIKEEGHGFFKTRFTLGNEDEVITMEHCDAEALEALVAFLYVNHEHPKEQIKDPRQEKLLADNIVQEQYRDYMDELVTKGEMALVLKVRLAAYQCSLEQLMFLTVVWLSFALTDEYTTLQLHDVRQVGHCASASEP